MASNFPTTVVPVASMPNNFRHLTYCQYTFVATENRLNSNENQLVVAPRVCRVRTRDNIMGIYAIADPIDSDMLASNISVNSLVERLNEVTFDDDSYKERIENVMRDISFEIENRLLQLTFDHAEEKVISTTSSVERAEKVLPALDEARSGAFLCATAVTQSSIFLSFVGKIRFFIISKGDKGLTIDVQRTQFYHNTSLHTFDNESEKRRLKKLNIDPNRARDEQMHQNSSPYTRCIGKLAEKFLSTNGSAADVNDAHCSSLICEATTQEIAILSSDYAMMMMTDNVYQMYLQTGISENDLPHKLANLFEDSVKSDDVAETILKTIHERYDERYPNSPRQSLGLLIHFFHRPISNLLYSLPIPTNLTSRSLMNEVTIEELNKFLQENEELEEKRRSKHIQPSNTIRHEREQQQQEGSIEPFVKFDDYYQVLNQKAELNEATRLITELLYTRPVSDLDEKLDEFLRLNPSLIDN